MRQDTHEKTQDQRILELLSDGKRHFSAEFRDRLGLLEYRKPITKLRRKGYEIVTLKIKGTLFDCYRPAYQLIRERGENGNI